MQKANKYHPNCNITTYTMCALLNVEGKEYTEGLGSEGKKQGKIY